MKISQIRLLELTPEIRLELIDELSEQGNVNATEEDIQVAFNQYKLDLEKAEQILIDQATALYNEVVCIALVKPELELDLDHEEIALLTQQLIADEEAECARLKAIEVANYDALVLIRLNKPVLPEDCNFLYIRQQISYLFEADWHEDIKIRYTEMLNYDAGMPAFHVVYPDKPNSALFFEKEILELGKELANEAMVAIEAKYIELKNAQTNLKAIEDRIAIGRIDREKCTKALDYVSWYNMDKGFNIEQITEMQVTFSPVEQALRAGRPDLSSQLITAIEPDGVLITSELKTTVLALLAP